MAAWTPASSLGTRWPWARFGDHRGSAAKHLHHRCELRPPFPIPARNDSRVPTSENRFQKLPGGWVEFNAGVARRGSLWSTGAPFRPMAIRVRFFPAQSVQRRRSQGGPPRTRGAGTRLPRLSFGTGFRPPHRASTWLTPDNPSLKPERQRAASTAGVGAPLFSSILSRSTPPSFDNRYYDLIVHSWVAISPVLSHYESTTSLTRAALGHRILRPACRAPPAWFFNINRLGTPGFDSENSFRSTATAQTWRRPPVLQWAQQLAAPARRIRALSGRPPFTRGRVSGGLDGLLPRFHSRCRSEATAASAGFVSKPGLCPTWG